MKFCLLGVFCFLPAAEVGAQVPSVRQAVLHREISSLGAMRLTGTPLPQSPLSMEYEPEYRFPLAVTLSGVQYYRNGFKQTNEMRYYINPQRAWMATCAGDNGHSTAAGLTASMADYDFDNNTVWLLAPSRKSALAMELNGASCVQNPMAATPKVAEENWKCHKTGKKKIILTLRCEECICVDAPRKVSSTMWVTFELNTNMAPAGLRSPFAPQLRAAQKTGGVLVEGNFYENGELKSFISMKELNRNANFTLSLEDYYVR